MTDETVFEELGQLAAQLASLPDAQNDQNLKFEREDWTSFRTVEGLQRKAGVPINRLRQLVLKEIVDNALDTHAKARPGHLGDNGYIVEDDGPGIDGTPEQIARLFSIARPMTSNKLLRLPTRGALGNGMRVIAGAVLASGGSPVVVTHNRRIALQPEHDGSTSVIGVEPAEHPVGTRIEITFGPAIPRSGDPMEWAEIACRLAGGIEYLGKASPWWYDASAFHEMVSASGSRPVRDLIAHLDDCTGAKAGEIVAAAQLDRVLCRDITREQAHRLLVAARENAKQVAPKRLGGIGPRPELGGTYVCMSGIVQFGSSEPFAEVPFVVETWVDEFDDDGEAETVLTVCVNRTPITEDIHASRDGKDIDAFGCGLANTIAKAPKTKQFEIWLNIITPYMPITSDGKAPNLKPFLTKIADAVGKAVKKATNPSAGSKLTQRALCSTISTPYELLISYRNANPPVWCWRVCRKSFPGEEETTRGGVGYMTASSTSAPRLQDRDDASKLVRVALNSLGEGVEVAIRSAGDAYRFTPNSYTAGALSDTVALRSLMALVAGRVTAIAEGGQ